MLYKTIFKEDDERIKKIEEAKQPIAIMPYNETAKYYLLKWNYPKWVKCIVDSNRDKQGWKIKHIPVVSMDDLRKMKVKTVIITSSSFKYEIIEELLKHKELRNLEIITTLENYSPFIHDKIGRNVYRELQSGPTSCLGDEAKVALFETLRSVLNLQGDILEVGCGCGGSTYLMALLLEEVNIVKKIYALDFFEPLYYMTMVLDEVKYYFKKFPFVKFVKGDMRKTISKTVKNKRFCFCFFDEWAEHGCIMPIYRKLVKNGIILFDNYAQHRQEIGKLLADKCFSNLPERIIPLPGTRQGLLIKR